MVEGTHRRMGYYVQKAATELARSDIDEALTKDELIHKVLSVRSLIQEWNEKKGHDRCWYYPEIFKKIADIVGVEIKPSDVDDLSRSEMEAGCKRYLDEVFDGK